MNYGYSLKAIKEPIKIELHPIHKGKAANGEIIECQKRPLEVGDRCVVMLESGFLCKKSGKIDILEIQSINGDHIKFIGFGSFYEGFVYQIIE